MDNTTNLETQAYNEALEFAVRAFRSDDPKMADVAIKIVKELGIEKPDRRAVQMEAHPAVARAAAKAEEALSV